MSSQTQFVSADVAIKAGDVVRMYIRKGYDGWTWEECVKALVPVLGVQLPAVIAPIAISRACKLVRGAYRNDRKDYATWCSHIEGDMDHCVQAIAFSLMFSRNELLSTLQAQLTVAQSPLPKAVASSK